MNGTRGENIGREMESSPSRFEARPYLRGGKHDAIILFADDKKSLVHSLYIVRGEITDRALSGFLIFGFRGHGRFREARWFFSSVVSGHGEAECREDYRYDGPYCKFERKKNELFFVYEKEDAEGTDYYLSKLRTPVRKG